ncbi:MAG: hypothetical protein AB2672_20585 [Candidatus Thiodiazotropha endolucinida]
MSINEQIATYAAFIAAMLTLLPVISGITGSQKIRKSILLTAVASTVALLGAGVAKIITGIPDLYQYVVSYPNVMQYLKSGWFGLWLLFVSWHFGLGVIIRLYVRSSRFKDWGTFANLRAVWPFVWLRKRFFRKKKDKKKYETDRVQEAEKKSQILREKYFTKRAKNRRAFLLSGDDPWEIRDQVVSYLGELISQTDEEINYVCCTVSPHNVWQMLVEKFKNDELNIFKKRMVFVDAYTETFGFEDEVLIERRRIMEADEFIEVVPCDSSAGVHSGTAKAFKILKKAALNEKRTRRPCTIVYDSLTVLSVPETETEVAEFIVHLTAAEHAYDMSTIFIEPDVENRDSETAKAIKAIRACCGTPILIGGDKDEGE